MAVMPVLDFEKCSGLEPAGSLEMEAVHLLPYLDRASAKARMVAVLLERLGVKHSVIPDLGKGFPVWSPRAGREGQARWQSELMDTAQQLGLDHILFHPLPTFELMREIFPSVDGYTLHNAMSAVLRQYQLDNTALFHLVKRSVSLDGINADADAAHIARHY